MAQEQTVLIIDDSLSVCRQVELALADVGIAVRQSHTGREAMRMLKDWKPDLILLDVVLPDTVGYELMEHLKAIEEIPIVFLTSMDSSEDVMRGFSLGACDYIRKPFHSAELKSRVLVHLGAKKRREELENAMEKLDRLAYRDELTGLYNRRYVVEKLTDTLAEPGHQNILVMVDIDDFKKVNDSYGHEAGDTALICIASLMEDICHGHVVARWGGEEFLIAMTDVCWSEAWDLCERMRQEVEAFPFVHGGNEFFCTITLGMAAYRQEVSMKANIKNADQALYVGKSSGKNQIRRYEADGRTGE